MSVKGGAAGVLDVPPEAAGGALAEEWPFVLGMGVLQRAVREGEYTLPGGAEEGGLVGWGLVHRLVALYVSGYFGAAVPDRAAMARLVDSALESIYAGWRSRGAEADA